MNSFIFMFAQHTTTRLEVTWRNFIFNEFKLAVFLHMKYLFLQHNMTSSLADTEPVMSIQNQRVDKF